jgi:hypothetical protein
VTTRAGSLQNRAGEAPVASFNADAEEFVLGAMMLSPAAVDAAREEIDASDFYYRDQNGLIFETLVALRARDVPTEVTFVEEELRRSGQLERVGGFARLKAIAAQTPSSRNVRHYARLVREAAGQRRLLETGQRVVAASQNGGLAAHPELVELLRSVIEPPAPRVPLRPLWLKDALERELPPVREYVEGVLQAGVVAEIAGAPYTHKSGLALELACKIAAGRGDLLGRYPILAAATVGYFWADDSEANELGRLQDYARRHGHRDLPLAFYLNPPLVLPDGLPLFSEEIGRHGFRFVVLDSVYNFAPGTNWNDSAEVTRIYSGLKRLCDEHEGLTVVVVDHAPKPSESTKGRHASISSFGSIFKAAQVRCSIALQRDGETLWISATGNNVRGFAKTVAVFDEDELEVRLVDAQLRDYRAEIVAFLKAHPGASQADIASGTKCRPETAKEILDGLALDGEATRETVDYTDAAGRSRKRPGWFLAAQRRHDFPTLGEAWEEQPGAAGHQGSPTATHHAPLGAVGRADGETGQGIQGAGTT